MLDTCVSSRLILRNQHSLLRVSPIHSLHDSFTVSGDIVVPQLTLCCCVCPAVREGALVPGRGPVRGAAGDPLWRCAPHGGVRLLRGLLHPVLPAGTPPRCLDPLPPLSEGKIPQGLPRVYLELTQGQSQHDPECSQGLPRVYPSPTQGLPRDYAGSTPGLPRASPGSIQGLPRAFPGAVDMYTC